MRKLLTALFFVLCCWSAIGHAFDTVCGEGPGIRSRPRAQIVGDRVEFHPVFGHERFLKSNLWLGQTEEWIAVHLSRDPLDGVYRSRSLGNLTPSVYRLDIRYRWRDINGLGWTDSYQCSFPATPVPSVPPVGSLIGFLLMLVVRWKSR